mgnify:CR=1 FL=1
MNTIQSFSSSRAQALDPQDFLRKFAVKDESHTHLSFKGGYDEFCRFKGKWCFPDDSEVQREVALAIEHLYECAELDESREYAYLIELKTDHFKFVQDLDIRGGGNFDLREFLCEQAKILHNFFPAHDLRCVAFDSSGFSRKRQEPKTSYHLAWNVIVDGGRAMSIHQATLDAFKLAPPGSTIALAQETLLAMHEENSWPNVIDDVVHQKNGVRMPYCDKYEGSGEKGFSERRPARSSGEYGFLFEEGCNCEVVRRPSDLPVHEWVLKGMLRTAEPLTEPFAPQRSPAPEPSLPEKPVGGIPIDYGALPDRWFAIVRDNRQRCVDAILEQFPGIEIRKITCAATERGVAVYLDSKKSDASKTCPFRDRAHVSNNIYFTWVLPANHVTVRCRDEACGGQEKRVASLGPIESPGGDIHLCAGVLSLEAFQRLASEGERGLAQLVAQVLSGEVVWTGRKWFSYNQHEAIWETKLDENLLGLEYDALRQAIDEAARHLGDSREIDALRRDVAKVAKRKSIREDLRDILSQPGFERHLDQQVNVLSCKNGVVDLRTGTIRPRAKEDYCTFYCDCIYAGLDSPTPIPENFVRELMLEDEDMCSYLQTILGYALCGINPKQGQRFFILCGLTSNGKSVLLKIISILLGPYCKGMESGTLQMHTKSVNSATPATRMLCPPVRIAFQDEQNAHISLDNSLIKEMTGGNVITARYLHENPIQYTPTFCPFLLTDTQPVCRAEASLKRRLRYIPFDAKFVADKDFDPQNPTHRRRIEGIEERFATEEAKSQFLTWLVKGAVRFHGYGSFSNVPQPAAVEEATEDFLAENDFAADFLALWDVSDPGAFSPIEDLHHAFETFTGQSIDRNELKTLLRGKGYKYTKCAKKVGRGKWGFQGISLRDA